MLMLIVITDGKGNVSLDENKKTKEELLEIGKKVKELSITDSMVIDIEKKVLCNLVLQKNWQTS